MKIKISQTPKVTLKVKTDSSTGKIKTNNNIVKNQLPQLPVEFVLNRSVDFGEF